jgi:hypothetical protein
MSSSPIAINDIINDPANVVETNPPPNPKVYLTNCHEALKPIEVRAILETPVDELVTTNKIANPQGGEVYVFFSKEALEHSKIRFTI